MSPFIPPSPHSVKGLELHKPSIVVLASPSAGGKTTQRRLLLEEDPTREFLISYTTRKPRPDEVDGVDYHFVSSPEEFERLVAKGDVIFEHTTFYGNHYGTPRKQLEEGIAQGKQMIADVNLDGLKAFRAAYPKQVRGVFIMPPSLDVLEQRLRKRISDAGALTDEQRAAMEIEVQTRLGQAPSVMKEARHYDCVIEQGDKTPKQTFAEVRQYFDKPTPIVSSVQHKEKPLEGFKPTLNHAEQPIGLRTRRPTSHPHSRDDNGAGKR